VEAQGMRNLYNKKGRVLYGTYIKKPDDTIQNEISYWTNDKIQRMSHDIHFSVVETWWE
jgi:hypothetical protein